jgi:hypothetical protein
VLPLTCAPWPFWFSLPCSEAFSRVLLVFKALKPVHVAGLRGVEFGLLVWLYSLVIGSDWLRRGQVLTIGLAGRARASQTFQVDNAVRLLESVSVIFMVLACYPHFPAPAS